MAIPNVTQDARSKQVQTDELHAAIDTVEKVVMSAMRLPDGSTPHIRAFLVRRDERGNIYADVKIRIGFPNPRENDRFDRH